MLSIVTTYFRVQKIAGAMSMGSLDISAAAAARHRQAEYDHCIRRNVACPFVSSVILLVQDHYAFEALRNEVYPTISDPAQREKITPLLFQGAPSQPLYSDLFRCANTLVTEGNLCMVCNADIFLSPTHSFFEKSSNTSNATPQLLRDMKKHLTVGDEATKQRNAFALTRYETEETMEAPLIVDYRGSHDGFVFASPLPDSFVASVQHAQNCYKAENIVLHEFQQHGFCVTNPCLSFKIFHKHECDARQWLPPVDEERYARAQPDFFIPGTM